MNLKVHDGVVDSLLAANHDSRLRSGGFTVGGSLSMWLESWVLQNVEFADANHDSRLMIRCLYSGVCFWGPNLDLCKEYGTKLLNCCITMM